MYNCSYTFTFIFNFVNCDRNILRRALHVIQALNGNKCNAYFVSGKIKELKKKKTVTNSCLASIDKGGNKWEIYVSSYHSVFLHFASWGQYNPEIMCGLKEHMRTERNSLQGVKKYPLGFVPYMD